jgi:endonuclease/exonuclease/phosphatase family metal-dependent hydrolase
VARIAAVIRELATDVIALQEVDSRGAAAAAGHPLDALSAACGLTAVAGPTIVRPDGQYGNALLTRLSTVEVHRHDLSIPGREPRGALAVTLGVDDAELRAVATHLGLDRSERLRQVRRLARTVDTREGPPTLLLADSNEWWPWARPLRELRRWIGGLPPVRSFPSQLPLLALDRIGAEGLRHTRWPRAHRSPTTRVASDHLPVVAEVELGGET